MAAAAPAASATFAVKAAGTLVLLNSRSEPSPKMHSL